MTGNRYLIVNADDFGLSPGVNRGIIKSHEQGIVTSASLMVRGPAAAEAAAYSREHPSLSLGLHIDLGEWTFIEGEWAPVYQVVPVNDRMAVAEEALRQVTTFRNLAGREPTHMDSHQHVHLREPVHSLVVEIAREVGIPLRHCSPQVRYCGDFYGQTAEGSLLPDVISVEGLLKILAALPTGITELACHPGELDNRETMYSSERAKEMKTLCDSRVKAAIEKLDIELCTFRKVRCLGPLEGFHCKDLRG
ncbi:carbohydrate deacetylase [Thermodesulfobacteriota bacterium]